MKVMPFLSQFRSDLRRVPAVRWIHSSVNVEPLKFPPARAIIEAKACNRPYVNGGKRHMKIKTT